jgi:hypothetical protein
VPARVGVHLSALGILESVVPPEVDVRERALAADGTANLGTGSA